MYRITYLFTLTVFILLVTSCYRLEDNGPDNPWTEVGLETETPIRTVHAAPLEVLVVTDDEFYRINLENEVAEKRDLLLPFNFFGRPVISDYTFVRMVRTMSDPQVAEFHLVRNADQIYELPIASLETNLDEQFELEGEMRNAGAYNIDGSQFLLPLRVLKDTERFYTFLLLDINMNANFTEIQSITLNRRIDIPDLPGDPGILGNVKFINGNYYVTSQEGAYRISPTGVVIPLLNSWRRDSFGANGKIYITSFEDFQFYVSDDNGVNWDLVGNPSSLKMVESANNQLFTQIHLGAPFHLVSDDLLSSDELVSNENFPEGSDSYFSNIVYFYGNYYLSNQKELYYMEEIETE